MINTAANVLTSSLLGPPIVEELSKACILESSQLALAILGSILYLGNIRPGVHSHRAPWRDSKDSDSCSDEIDVVFAIEGEAVYLLLDKCRRETQDQPTATCNFTIKHVGSYPPPLDTPPIRDL